MSNTNHVDEAALARLHRVVIGDLMDDPAVTDLYVQPADSDGLCLRVIKRRGVLVRSGYVRVSDVSSFLARVSAKSGREYGEDRPWLQAKLPGGQRLSATFHDVSDGPSFSLRQPSREAVTIEMLVAWRFMNEEQAEAIVRYLKDGRNFLIGGNPGAGKTTLLRALAAEPCVSAGRVVVVQDPNEFFVTGDAVLHFEADESAENPVTVDHCVNLALRADTETLVVGEIRTMKTAKEVLRAYNSVSRTLATIHAKSAHKTPRRLASLTGAKTGDERRELAEDIEVCVYVRYDRRTERRWVESVSEVSGYRKGEFTLDNEIRYDPYLQ